MGGMGWGHTWALNEMKGVKVVACRDVNEKSCSTAAKELGMPAFYTDHREMLKKEKLDAVSCATSDGGHCPVSLAAIKKGLRFLMRTTAM
jgi:predicted dehydrogenase